MSRCCAPFSSTPTRPWPITGPIWLRSAPEPRWRGRRPYLGSLFRCYSDPVDGEDHVGLRERICSRRDFDDRSRRRPWAHDVACPDQVDELAEDRTGRRGFETTRSARESRVGRSAGRFFGMRSRLRLDSSPRHRWPGFRRASRAEQRADLARVRRRSAAGRRSGDRGCGSAVGPGRRARIGGGRVAKIEDEVGLPPHDDFEIDRVAAAGQAAESGKDR